MYYCTFYVIIIGYISLFSQFSQPAITWSKLTLKRLRSSIWPPLWFSKNASFQERAKAWFFVTLNIIISHTFPENFIEINQVVQKILSLSLSIFLSLFLVIFIIFWMFWHFLVTKKRMMSLSSLFTFEHISCLVLVFLLLTLIR